jgi:hypothetical protein
MLSCPLPQLQPGADDRAAVIEPRSACDGLAERVLPTIGSPLPHFARSLGFLLIMVAVALSCAVCGQSPPVLTAFRTELQAQQHCPSDTVVWVDPQSGMYQLKGHGSYGSSDAGRYACRGEAERAGFHATTN